MRTYQLLNTTVGAIALLLVLLNAARAVRSGQHQRRLGTPSSMVGAGMTAQAIGLGLALAGASGGGYAVFSVLEAFELPVVVHLVTQLAAALAGSWLVGWIYFTWLAQPVYRWFAGEEGTGYGR